MDLKGKRALVTGASSGVGRATAVALARQGCAVVVNYSRSADGAAETVASVRTLGVESLAIQADVGDDAGCRALVAETVERLGGLDVLINNAGVTRFIPHEELDRVEPGDWNDIFAVNVLGPFHCARAARTALAAGDGGAIVNVSSIAGLAGVGSSIPYCASKAALNNLTVTLARTLAPKIRVNAVAPGFIAGRWLEAGLGPAYEQMKAFVETRAPLRRVCEPEDVAQVILSLVSGSDLVTGQIVTVDGGLLLGGATG